MPEGCVPWERSGAEGQGETPAARPGQRRSLLGTSPPLRQTTETCTAATTPEHQHTLHTPPPRPAPTPAAAFAFPEALWPPILAGVSRRAPLSPNCGRSSLSLRKGEGHDPSHAGTSARPGQMAGTASSHRPTPTARPSPRCHRSWERSGRSPRRAPPIPPCPAGHGQRPRFAEQQRWRQDRKSVV